MEELGTLMREARLARNLTLDDVSRATKIPKSTLAQLEASELGALPAAVFVRGFIRAYARVVGTDPNPLVRLFEAESERMGEGEDKGLYPEPLWNRQAASGADAAPAGAPGVRVGRAKTKTEELAGRTRIEKRLDPERKLVPLTPVSERSEGGFRGGYAMLAVVAVGLLVAAWLLVGGKRPSTDASARLPGDVPGIDQRIDGPAFGGTGLGGNGLGGNGGSMDGARPSETPRDGATRVETQTPANATGTRGRATPAAGGNAERLPMAPSLRNQPRDTTRNR